MTGVAGNAYTLAMGKQSAKGTPQTTPTYKMRLTGGDVSAVPTVIQLAETDASRQAGTSVKTGGAVTGSTTHYLRPDEFGLLAYLVMGANADSGAGPNYTHTATPSSAAPYATLYKAINVSTLVDQYVDCRVSSLTVSGQAGGALTVAPTWEGLSAVFGATDPVLTPVTTSPLVYPQVIVTKGGATPGTIDSFDLTISNNGQMVAGDSGYANIDYVFGQFAVSGTISTLFASDADYRAFNTGTTSGTAFTATMFSEALTITATVNANLSVQFVMTAVEYTSYPLAPNTDGSPLRVAMAFRTVRQAAIASNLTIITKNQVVSY